MLFNPLHQKNAVSPIFIKCGGSFICIKLVHEKNAEVSILVILSGSVIFAKLVQSPKVPEFMLVIPSGILISFNPVHALKAYLPMADTFSEMVIYSKFLLPANALSPIFVILSEILKVEFVFPAAY